MDEQIKPVAFVIFTGRKKPDVEWMAREVERGERLYSQQSIDALRAEVEMLRDAFSDEDMTAGAHWFGRYVEQKRRAEQLAEEVEALRAGVERLTSEVRSLRQQYDERTVYMVVHRGAALACSDSMRAAYSDEHRRAERLAEALRNSADALERLAFAIPAPNVHTPQLATLAIAMRNAAIQRTDAALDQARGKGVADES